MNAGGLTTVVDVLRRLCTPNLRCLTDDELLVLFSQDKDQAAFAELVRRHGPMVLAVCRRVLRHEQDAEDAFQAAFLVLARKAGSIRQRRCIGPWMYQVTYRLAMRARTISQHWCKQLGASMDTFLSRPVRGANSLDLDKALDGLPQQYRAVVVLCYLEGRTQSEAARLLATTTDAINSRLKRARELLRQRLGLLGAVLSAAALAERLSAAGAKAALPTTLVEATVRQTLSFLADRIGGISILTLTLVKGALSGMSTSTAKLLSAMCLGVILLIAGSLFVPAPVVADDPPAQAFVANSSSPTWAENLAAPEPDPKAKPLRACILLWMGGGPSQMDTFDPKPADPNNLFVPIDTNVKGLQFSQLLPKLAKQANHLAVFRTMNHGQADHARGTFLMRTGRDISDQADFPALGCILAKELGDARGGKLPRYVSIGGGYVGPGFGPGFLGNHYGPLIVRGVGGADPLPAPPLEAFEEISRAGAQATRKSVLPAFNLAEEKPEVRDAYGRNTFGQGCLLARRLIDRGVPVVEVRLGGWDTHANTLAVLPQRCADLDAGWSALLADLHKSKRLDTTLIVWMGEFGRTPRVNLNGGRDHWSRGFSAVLAGGPIKGGRAIGKTSPDGSKIDERPVSPAELHATIYQALGFDSTKDIRSPTGQKYPLVERGTKAVKEALP